MPAAAAPARHPQEAAVLTPERVAALRPGPLQGRQGQWQPLQGAFADVRLVWTCLQYAYQINNELKGACLLWSRMMKQAASCSDPAVWRCWRRCAAPRRRWQKRKPPTFQYSRIQLLADQRSAEGAVRLTS